MGQTEFFLAVATSADFDIRCRIFNIHKPLPWMVIATAW